MAASLLDDGAAVVVARLHDVSGLRPALKLDISEEEVTLTVLTVDFSVQSYRWRDGVIDLADTDVQYLGQTIFWPTDFAINNVRRLFDVATLHGTSSNGQVLQVVEYGPGRVFMSVTTSPETRTVFFRKDGSIVRSLTTSSVTDIREGISDVAGGASELYMVGFDSTRGFFAELPAAGETTERRSRMANRPVFSSQRAGLSSLVPFDPALLDAGAIAQVIASRAAEDGCSVEIDNRFNRVQPVIIYQCAGKTFYSDLRGTDLTDQLG